MALKVNITLSGNVFAIEGDFLITAAESLFRVWMNAQGLGTPVTVEELTEQLEGSTQRLNDAVQAHTPVAQP